jgi:superfamily II DNA or RNA helicase
MNHIDVFNTHIEIYPYRKDDIPAIEDMYTATDKFSNKQFACGYLIDNEKLYLPRGTSISKLEMLLECKANYIQESDDYGRMTQNHSSIYDPRNKIQEESIRFLKDDTKQCALNLKTGIGKCEPNSRKIPSPDSSYGYIQMGEIKPGNRVFGSDGEVINVLAIYPQGEKDVYRITFSDGRYAECGAEHLWTVYNKYQLDYECTMTTQQLLSCYNEYVVPVITEGVKYPSKVTVINPKLYGLHFSDIVSKYKYLDEDYLFNDCITRMHLLEGLVENGYYIRKSRFNNSLKILRHHCSKDLYEQLQWLLSSLRYVQIKKNVYCNNIPFISITKIELIGKEECTCIMVDSKDHLYLSENFIVTHNTFCVAYASTALNERTIIITPNESLKQQWIKTYNTMFDYRGKQLMNIAGSNVIEGIMNDNIDIENTDVFFVNHQTLRSYITSTNGYQFHNFMKKIKVGIKVYDESHMEFGNILLIDFFSNTNRTWYLTATFDRSDKTESVCFKRAFQSVEAYGDIESAEVVRKHVIFHKVSFNSRINPQQRAKLLSYPGFAQPIETLIPIPTGGCKRLKDLKKGDYILSEKGKPIRITKIIERPNEDAYKLKFSDDRESISSIEHLWYVKDVYKDNTEYTPMMLKDIMSDYIFNSNDTVCYRYRIPNNSSIPYPHKDVPIDPYIFAAFIGDGSCGDEYLNLSNIEGGPKEGIVRYIESHENMVAIYDSYDQCHFYKNGKLVKTDEYFIKETIGIVNCEDQYKYIPNEYIYNDEDTRWSILQGLMDTGGRIKIIEKSHTCYNTIEYSSTSKQLLRDIETICHSLGIGTGYYEDSHVEKYSIEYCGVLYIKIKNELVPKLFRYNSKKCKYANIVSKYKSYVDRDHISIRKIENMNQKMDMRCIEVDNPTHLYLSNDYIVTHNCANRYGLYSIFEDKNETLYKVILEILKKTENVEGKTLIFVPLIDCVDEIVKKLRVDFPQKTCGAYHSKIPKNEKEIAERKDIIVSTIKSCGTGRDIKGLRVIICAEPVVSKVVIEQTIGRLREYKPGKDTYYFDLVDYSIPQINYWYRARYRKIETLVKDTVLLEM